MIAVVLTFIRSRFINPFLLSAVTILAMSPAAEAVTLNFEAKITKATCDISLSQTLLTLGTIPVRDLKSNTVTRTQSFTLNISNCQGIPAESQTSVIKITGEGELQGGKWLFRSAERSRAGSTGILLFQRSTEPVYSDREVKNGDEISLMQKGGAQIVDKLPFYAGVSCGGDSGCASVKAGAVSATLIFDFVYA